jgi:diguanylate cyclase (GGDEF)-like protein
MVIGPLHERYVGRPVPIRFDAPCLVVAVPTLTGLLALGVLAALAVKVGAARLVCLAAAVAVLAASALPATVFFGEPVLTVVAGVAFALALPLLAVALRAPARTPALALVVAGAEPVPGAAASPPGTSASPPGADATAGTVIDRQPQSGLGLSLGMVTLALVAGVIQVIFRPGSMDRIGVTTAVVIGAALAAQQALARIELSRTTDRLVLSEAHYRAMAYTDPLTELANRRQLLVTLQEEAVGGPPCVLLAIDLDGFKNVNDIRGHDVGDAVLVEVARRLTSHVRPGDLAVRMGGDEFAVLMWARGAEATAVAERLLAVLSEPYEVGGGAVFVAASIGLATCRTADTIEGLMRNADVALRFAKQRGKHRFEQYDLAYDQWLRRRNDLEQELRGAVDRGELMLVYQPVVRLADGRVAGVEALLRWHHPRLGQVPPDEFIPVAEESGLIGGLGEFVLDEACYQLSRWLDDGHDVDLAVNVSVRELHADGYPAGVAEILRRHRVPPQRLVLEVTEHAVALDVERIVERLTALREAGVRVALDDFGAGYSSLGQLRSLPVDILKIDRTLTAPPEPGPGPVKYSAPLADVVVQLGQRIGLDVVAEGITDVDQRRVLEEAGCRYAQGDLFGRPMPAERVEALFGDKGPAGGRAQNVGSVDSGHEMRQS